MRGPAPKPTKIRMQEGNPSRRPFNPREPQPAGLSPSRAARMCPKGATQDERKIWRHFSRKLAEAGILTELDLDALMLLVRATAELEKLEGIIQKSGYLITDRETGRVKVNPLLAMRDRARDVQRKLLSDFGMLPGPRSRVQTAAPEGGVDSLAEILRTPRPDLEERLRGILQ